MYLNIKLLVLSLFLINIISCGGGSKDNEVDETPPTIELIGSESLSIVVGSTYVDEGATAIDNVDGSVVIETVSDLDPSRIGTYQITYIATDSAGNKVEIVREIVVEATAVNTEVFEGKWLSDCIVGSDSSFKVLMDLAESANTGLMTINGFTDECITPDYQAMLNISLSYPSSHISSVCSNAVKVNGSVNYPIEVLVEGQTESLSIPNERFLNNIGFFEEDFLVAFDLMCTDSTGTILYSGLVTDENDGSSDSRRPVSIDTDGFWRKQ